jgi:hypothetical protein
MKLRRLPEVLVACNIIIGSLVLGLAWVYTQPTPVLDGTMKDPNFIKLVNTKFRCGPGISMRSPSLAQIPCEQVYLASYLLVLENVYNVSMEQLLSLPGHRLTDDEGFLTVSIEKLRRWEQSARVIGAL